MSKLDKFLQIFATVGLPALRMIPGVPPGLGELVLAGIQRAEAYQGADGATKKQVVLDMVAIGTAGANTVARATGKGEILDQNMAQTIAGHVIDTVVGVVNVTHRLPDPVPAPSPTGSPV